MGRIYSNVSVNAAQQQVVNANANTPREYYAVKRPNFTLQVAFNAIDKAVADGTADLNDKEKVGKVTLTHVIIKPKGGNINHLKQSIALIANSWDCWSQDKKQYRISRTAWFAAKKAAERMAAKAAKVSKVETPTVSEAPKADTDMKGIFASIAKRNEDFGKSVGDYITQQNAALEQLMKLMTGETTTTKANRKAAKAVDDQSATVNESANGKKTTRRRNRKSGL